MKKCYILIVLLLCAAILCACNDVPDPTDPVTDPTGTSQPEGQLTYTVTVVDPAGEPFDKGVIVSFVSASGEKTMQQMNAQGVAQKTLPSGIYTVELGFMDAAADYHYDTADLTLTPEKTELRIVLSNKVSVKENIIGSYDPVTGEEITITEQLYYASTGYTYIPLTAGERTYVYFAPAVSGIYQFRVVDADAVIGYYGSPYFIQSENAAERGSDGSITINVSNGMIGTGDTGTSVLVLGVDGGDLTQCFISIQRISDPEMTVEDYPWEYYSATVDLGKFTVSDQVQFHDFDLTADGYTLVLNEDDGFYHLNTADGPLVYAKLGVDSKYLGSIQTVLESSGINCYYFDKDGKLLKKVNFSDCLMEYIACMDEDTGLYPLTKDLAYIFQERGKYVGWWDSSSNGYLFLDSNGNKIIGINPEIAWLFLCCYGEVPADPGPTEPPTQPTEPSTQPTEPPTKPTEPPKQPTEPPTKPTEPVHTHSYTATVVAATCTEGGYTRYSCACGHSYTSDETAAAGHKWDQWTVVKEPSLFTDGEERRSCSVCAETENRIVNSLLGTHSTEEPVELFYYQIAQTMSFDAAIKSREYADFKLYRMNSMILTIESEDAYLIFNGEVIEPVNGVLTFALQYARNDAYTPCSISIGNRGEKDTTFQVKISTLDGIWENPAQLQLGTFTTVTRAGDGQGYFYTFTATSDGSLTVSFVDMDLKYDCQISIQDTNEFSTKATMTEINGTVTMELSAGDTVRIQIEVLDPDYKFPSAHITATAAFK